MLVRSKDYHAKVHTKLSCARTQCNRLAMCLNISPNEEVSGAPSAPSRPLAGARSEVGRSKRKAERALFDAVVEVKDVSASRSVELQLVSGEVLPRRVQPVRPSPPVSGTAQAVGTLPRRIPQRITSISASKSTADMSVMSLLHRTGAHGANTREQ